MKFIITRTSQGAFDEGINPPCKGAVKEILHEYIDRRTVKTLKEAAEEKHKHWGKEFLENGKNHREEFGGVARDVEMDETIWVIEINTIQELIKLYEKEGSLIIHSPYPENHIYKLGIEIYDDYRE